MRSGYTDVSYSYLRDAGHLNYSWSPSSNADTLRAYNLRINDLEVFSSAGPFTRYLGFSLRCLQEYEGSERKASHLATLDNEPAILAFVTNLATIK